MADGKTYRVMATDSAGTEFQLGAFDEAIKALAMLKGAPAQFPVKSLRVLNAAGEPVEELTLRSVANEEIQKIAYERALDIRRSAPGETDET